MTGDVIDARPGAGAEATDSTGGGAGRSPKASDAALRIDWLGLGERELPPDGRWLSPAERERAASLRFRKRRDDYLMGRFVAKRAVACALSLSQGVDSLARIEVKNALTGPRRGAPTVYVDGEPAALGISISDRAGWGVCAVGPAGARLGCDLELVEPRSPAFVRDYLTELEADRVFGAPDPESRHLLANLHWCAKESALKVLQTGLRRDTRSVEVALLPEEGAKAGWQRLSVTDRASSAELPGWWRRFGAFLLTMAAEAETAPPQSLDGAPGLETAVPSHTWLEDPIVDA